MAEVSKITLPNKQQYNLKDITARSHISATGNVHQLKASDIGITVINNTLDKDKNVNSANTATSAGKLTKAVNINGVSFDGSKDVTITDSTKLSLTGGTMTGGIAFAATGDTGTSAKISFSGSTDSAEIYYNAAAKDQGNLVFNMLDDANAYVQFAANGVAKAWVSPSDGTFHGTLAGNASSATKLATKRTIGVNLALQGSVDFDGSENASVGVTGILPVNHGGTGHTSGVASANYFINELTTGTSTPVDNDYFISQYVNGGTATTTYHRRPMSALWGYVNGKMTKTVLDGKIGTATTEVQGLMSREDKSFINSQKMYYSQSWQTVKDIYPTWQSVADQNATWGDLISNRGTTMSLVASGWTGTSAPYKYELGNKYANKSLIVGLNSDMATSDQVEAMMAAQIQGGTGTTLYAWGDKPTKDIPIVIQY